MTVWNPHEIDLAVTALAKQDDSSAVAVAAGRRVLADASLANVTAVVTLDKTDLSERAERPP